MKKLLSLILLIAMIQTVVACSYGMAGKTLDNVNDQEETEQSGQKNKIEMETANENDQDQEESKAKKLPPVNEKDAVRLIREHLGLEEHTTLHVEVDHEEGNKYVVHVYEIVTHDDISHTATYGWYYVSKDSGKIEDMME
ncbi:hypothetical protein [Metabacillus bambusae]|uniref:PepSY domain-containing protein n=1 Tax=Metabacillus bambusae TaxID=2795218 RepID=A0ABS3N3Q6_9BACI|nr:hypothetical protein [Metabacillus bambusae]MBO1512912.1 hypothetical protein [Metabacillus bambusae]